MGVKERKRIKQIRATSNIATLPVETKDIVNISISKKLAEAIDRAAVTEGAEVEEILTDVFGDGFYVAEKDINESVVTLKYVEPWSGADRVVEPKGAGGTETPQTIKTFRRLRDDFPPVTAGIDYSRAFTSGGGFEVDIENPDDEQQKKNKDIINDLNRNVYQDEVTRGLDEILDILLDEAFTVGCSAAEIVYDKFKEDIPNWDEYSTVTPPEERMEGVPEYTSNELTNEQWKSLNGIVQLKIIDDAIGRMKCYRHPTTYKIEYWTIDEDATIKRNSEAVKNKQPTVEVAKLFPWQVLWLGWDKRGSSLTGTSLIRSVAKTSILLEDILNAVGTSFKKWSDRKFFFVLGSDKTGRSWAPVKITNFLRDVKKMTTEGGTGVAVPAGFDIKDIGGDVFEGSAIIDNLVSLICAGMRYPRTFLEQGKTQEGDKAWLAWIVTYAGHQKLLRRAIEHQLWARHLYSVNGSKSYKVKKQGVPIEKQESASVYVPKMSWKSEGKWHIQQKIDELSKILNVANPVSPELKLEVESDLAATLGYSELSLDNARKVLKLRQEISLVEAEVDKTKTEILREIMEKALTDKEFKDSVIPLIQGTTKKAPDNPEPTEPKVGGEGINPKRPPPVPLARLAGGVSRTNRDEPNQKGIAKPPGGTRQPKPNTGMQKQESLEGEEETVQFESYEDFLLTSIKMREHRDKMSVYEKMIEVLDKIGGDN